MNYPAVVIDTNVLIAALISRQGKAFKLLALIGNGQFEICLSPAVVLEYEDVIKRLLGSKIRLTDQDIDDVLDYLCTTGRHQTIYYLWRPYLSDPKDDMMLELAVSGKCQFIVTYNIKDFKGVEQFGIEAITPAEFLTGIGEDHEHNKSAVARVSA